jgi:hypothetical protein
MNRLAGEKKKINKKWNGFFVTVSYVINNFL